LLVLVRCVWDMWRRD